MTTKHMAAKHHASAAIHHEQAAQSHHMASKHYEIGKDYAHAAHQALLAHGHAMEAIEHGHQACNSYPEQNDEMALKQLATVGQPAAQSLVSIKRAIEPRLSAAEHHEAAAGHHEHAAKHHLEASKSFADSDYTQAAHEARTAHIYAKHGVFHSNEAAKLYVEHYGKARPTAQIA